MSSGLIFDKTARVYRFMEYEQPVSIMSNAVVRESRLGAYSFIGASTQVHYTTVGRYCSFGPGCRVGPGEHPVDRLTTSSLAFNDHFKFYTGVSALISDFDDNASTTIGNDVWLGADSIVKNGIEIGDGAVVAAGSVVTKSVAPYAIIGGTPAKVIKDRFDDQTIERLLKLKWWRFDLPAWAANGNLSRLDVLTSEALDRIEESIAAGKAPRIAGRKYRVEFPAGAPSTTRQISD